VIPDLVVAGAGMAGLAAAARARELGATVRHLEKAPEPGGAMRRSSGVLWRHAEWEEFRRECPDGDEALQRALFERLDADLDWLEARGARVTAPATGNPRTVGRRFDPDSIVAALAGEIECSAPLAAPGGDASGARDRALPDGVPVVLATGGFAASRELLREHVTPEADALLLRAPAYATGDGLAFGLAAGGRLSAGMGEIYGRVMPAAPLAPERWIGDAQLYARHATVTDEAGERYEARTWSETDVVQWLARRPGARGWLVVAPDKLGERTPYGSVAEQVARAEAAGAEVRRGGTGAVSVHVAAAVTTTLGGLATDARGRLADGVWAAGADAGGIAAGGYASGLAGALVMGRIAAEAALAA
jgi:succinate dehydrogenase/fumarate reductase flavoprotein subunit